jgi:hypothetical protein
MESNNGVTPNKVTRTEVSKRMVLSDFAMDPPSNVRFVVLANDLMDVEPTNGDPKKIIIAAAVQSVAVVIIPSHQVLTSIYPGDALYAKVNTGLTDDVGKIELVSSARNTGPPTLSEEQWSLLGYVVVQNGLGERHLHVSLVPHER